MSTPTNMIHFVRSSSFWPPTMTACGLLVMPHGPDHPMSFTATRAPFYVECKCCLSSTAYRAAAVEWALEAPTERAS